MAFRGRSRADTVHAQASSANHRGGRRVAVVAWLCAIAVLAYLLLVQREAAERELVQQYEENHRALVSRMADAMMTFAETCFRHVDLLASLLGASNPGTGIDRGTLALLLEEEPLDECGTTFIYDSNDALFFSSGPEGAEPTVPHGELLEWARAPENASERRLFGPYRVEEAVDEVVEVTGVDYVSVAPIVGSGPSVSYIGVIVQQVSLRSVIEAGQLKANSPTRGEAWIMDSSGVLLWHSAHPEMTLNSTRTFWDEAESDCRGCHESLDHVDRILDEQDGSTVYAVRGQPRTLVSYAPARFGDATWIVAYTSPYERVVRFASQSWRLTIAVLIGVSVLLTVGFWWVFRSNRRRLLAETTAKRWRQKQAFEKRLRRAEHRYQTMIESAHDAIWSVDPQGDITFMNSRAAELFTSNGGKGPKGGTGRVRIAEIPGFVEATDDALAGLHRSIEATIPRPNGDVVMMSVDTVPLQEDGRVVGAVSFARDITEHRRSELLIRKDNERRRILNAILRIGLSDEPLERRLEQALRELLGINQLRLSPQGGIFLVDKASGMLRLVAQHDMPMAVRESCSLVAPGECICGRAAQTKRCIYTDCVDDRHDKVYPSLTEHGHYALPIMLGEELLGVIVLYVPAHEAYNSEDEEFLAIVAGTLASLIQREQAAQALRASEERYSLAAEGARDGLWEWDLERNTVFYSDRWQAMLGLQPGAIEGTPESWLQRVHPDDLGELRARLDAHLSRGASHFETEYRARHQDGSYRWMISRGQAVWDPSGKPLRMAGSQSDITARKLAERQLLHRAFHDDLTGLPNRALFMQRLGWCLKRKRRRPEADFAILFIDLDQFKVLNDSFGHVAGDEMLREVAQRLVGLVRESDTVARFGGDEFAVLLDEVAGLSDATRVAARLADALREPFVVNGSEVFTTASVGIAISTTPYDDCEDMLRDADIAMYRAKAVGRGHYQVFDKSMHAQAIAVMQLENDLRHAVANEEFALEFQPIVSAATGRVVSVEALVRWKHPDRGLIPPHGFIPIAEETEVIVDLGAWVLRTACAQTREWRERGCPDLMVAVNVSARQFERSDMLATVRTILADTGLPASALELELTESSVMGTGASNIATLESLLDLGVSLALDDFGTGYSSLFALRHLPIERLKIDRSFVTALESGSDDGAIIAAVVQMAHCLDMMVTAEGVETRAQLEKLRSLGCDDIQGFYFMKPGSVGAVTGYLAASNRSRAPARKARHLDS